MIEVEIKVRIDDPGPIRSRLEAMGGTCLGRQVQEDTYYNAQSRDFAGTDEALRIRRTDGGSLLTYKGPRIHARSKSREEIEIPIGDPDGADAILRALGFSRVMTVTKSRDMYRLDRYDISVDTVNGLGTFLEIETTAENEREMASRVDAIYAFLPELGIDQEDTITQSYLELLT